jgi:hypothetical protein
MFDPSKIDIEDNNDDKKKNIKKEGKKDENKPLSSDILNEIKKENQIKTTPKKVVKKKIIKKAPAKKIITEKKSDIIYDINITNIDLLLNIITDNEYDFAICEPFETYVQITFSKDKIIKNTKYIKYHIYSNILIKAKALTKLKIDEIISVQE